ncbi:unnamed protein product, partial [Closterium sp. NIES-65]
MTRQDAPFFAGSVLILALIASFVALIAPVSAAKQSDFPACWYSGLLPVKPNVTVTRCLDAAEWTCCSDCEDRKYAVVEASTDGRVILNQVSPGLGDKFTNVNMMVRDTDCHHSACALAHMCATGCSSSRICAVYSLSLPSPLTSFPSHFLHLSLPSPLTSFLPHFLPLSLLSSCSPLLSVVHAATPEFRLSASPQTCAHSSGFELRRSVVDLRDFHPPLAVIPSSPPSLLQEHERVCAQFSFFQQCHLLLEQVVCAPLAAARVAFLRSLTPSHFLSHSSPVVLLLAQVCTQFSEFQQCQLLLSAPSLPPSSFFHPFPLSSPASRATSSPSPRSSRAGVRAVQRVPAVPAPPGAGRVRHGVQPGFGQLLQAGQRHARHAGLQRLLADRLPDLQGAHT